MTTPIIPTTPAPLSPREVQVLQLAAEGLTDRQIAARLTIDRRTAATHMFNLRHRLAARNRAHAVTLGFRLGLIPLPTPTTTDPDPLPVPEAIEQAKARALWQALVDAGPVGITPSVQARQLGRSPGYVYHLLRTWARDGWVQPSGHGHWRATATRIPVAG